MKPKLNENKADTTLVDWIRKHQHTPNPQLKEERKTTMGGQNGIHHLVSF